ncbi:MAG: flagellar hook-associated protein FlgK [Deltaproteobacteria bacterium]|nr:flagellar hook-associated protein FlgK [Deltaproteobacteria bacterium]
MSGLGLVLDVAKEALLAQRYAIDIVSHNIANVNTPGYTRQTATLLAKEASPLGGVMLGRGVSIDEVIQNTDAFIEARLRDRKTELMAMSEKEVYMSAFEGIFSESSGSSLSTQLSDFWNAWQDLSNNPSGTSERNILYERGALLTESFQGLYEDMNQILNELENVIKTGVDTVNNLLSNIADLNQQIIQIEVAGNANDLRDQRNLALSQLAEYMDIKSYENEDGNLTVTTGRGYVLVSRGDAYPLKVNGTEIQWEGSGSSVVTITDTVTGGKLGGWLDIRDEIIPEYKADMDALAAAVIWETNKVHSQGVGLEAMSSVTGTYQTTTTLDALAFGSNVDFNKSFKLWIGDANGDNLQEIEIDMTYVNGGIGPVTGASALADLAASINDQITTKAGLSGVTATVSAGKLQLTADATHTFAFSDDTSGILAALGVNAFFAGSSANDIGMNSVLNADRGMIAAGRVDSSGGIASGDNSNALAIANLQYESVTVKKWTYERGSAATSSDETGTLEAYYHSFVGSIGVDSQSITRAREFNETIVETLSATRDNISAVSLDEEMTNLIKYQHAYAAAAKLISAADEMLQILLETK